MRKFFESHPLLSSFLCLLILSTILEFYRYYVHSVGPVPLKLESIEKVIYFVKSSTLGAAYFWSVPVLFISLILWSFLKKESSSEESPTFYSRFALSLVPAFTVTLFFSISIIRHHKPIYYSRPDLLYPLAIITTCFYGAAFGAFFGWLSKGSKARIIIYSVIVNLLMGLFYYLLFLLSKISM